MPTPLEILQSIRARADDALTNYLRQTTTDQELLDFYGEGNIIGRKGIPDTYGGVIDQAIDVRKFLDPRPHINRIVPEEEGFLTGLPGGETQLVDMPGAISPKTNRPYQLQFETLPFPTEGRTTAAAQRFLSDFRVPTGQAIDYGFEISPNVVDVKAAEALEITKDPYNYKDTKAAFDAINAGQVPQGELRPWALEELKKIESRASGIRRFSGQMATPSVWQSRGFEVPKELKDETLNTFKNEILKQEKPFGSVSQLTPVVESPENVRPGGDPNWRANLYEKQGFAGPLTEVSVRSAYGPVSDNVQMFTRGKDRLLPLQPYTEFLSEYNASKPSALGTKPAPDFTSFQKAVGTRNYLIGRNILEGRGNLGKGFRATAAATVVPVAGKFLSFLGPVGDSLDLAEGISTAANPNNTAGNRIAGGIQAGGAAYGLGGLGAAVMGAPLPGLLPVTAGAALTAEGIRAAERMKDPAIKNPDAETFKMAMPYVSTAGFNRNKPLLPGKGIAILNGKPILVDKGSVAGNKMVGRPWWDVGQYLKR